MSEYLESPTWAMNDADDYGYNDSEQYSDEYSSSDFQQTMDTEESFYSDNATSDYTVTLRSGQEVDVDIDSAEYKAFDSLANYHGLDDDARSELINLFVQHQFDSGLLIDTDSQMEQLGANAEERIQFVDSWAGNNLTEAETQTLMSMARTKDQFELIESTIRLINNLSSQQGINLNGSTSTKSGVMSKEAFEEAVRDPRYHQDRHFREKVLRAAKAAGW